MSLYKPIVSEATISSDSFAESAEQAAERARLEVRLLFCIAPLGRRGIALAEQAGITEASFEQPDTAIIWKALAEQREGDILAQTRAIRQALQAESLWDEADGRAYASGMRWGPQAMGAMFTRLPANEAETWLGRIASELAGKGAPCGSEALDDAVFGAAAEPKPPQAGPIITCLADVQPREIEWLWPGRIAIGKLNLLFGDPGLGKSFITLDMAARVSTGRQWPDGSGKPQPGKVMLINCEDDMADTVLPRLIKADADVRQIIALEGFTRTSDNGRLLERSFTLAEIPTLSEALRSHPGIRLLIVDPVSAYLQDTDSHNNAEIRGLLAPLAKLASDHRIAVVLVTHMSKSAGGRAMYRAMGSLAFIAAARSAWAVAKDKADPKRRLFLPAKNNIGNDETGLAYQIVDGVVQWERDPVDTRLDDALADDGSGMDRQKPGPDPVATTQAAEWLAGELADMQEHPTKDLRTAAEQAGLAWRTVQRASTGLGVIVHRGSFQGGYVWRLPKPAPSVPTCTPSTPLSK